ncbi:hypothetical protein HDF26_004288 [Pedobacter cryoconitis]|nr:hypothetical protein [Pedobacter cryoconitis]
MNLSKFYLSTTISFCILTVISCKKSEAQSPPADLIASAVPSLSTVALVPAKGALLGHYYGTGTISETDAIIGSRPQIHLSYFGWSDHWAKDGSTRQDLLEGRIPLVNWEPFDVKFTAIVNGKYDGQISLQADEARELGKLFFLDFAAEMNEEEGWGGHNPELYIKAYRHIHDIFVRQGATNVVWVWCPNNVDSPGGPTAMQYYPGDVYVDWVGVDGYNWGTSNSDHEWETFYQVFKEIYAKIAATGKPVIIGEMASDEVGGDKAKWISEIIPTLKSQFPAIKAVVWFDVDKERHWQINSKQNSLDAYRLMAKDPYFNTH